MGCPLLGRKRVCSENFSDDEIASLNGISGDMYSLTEPPIPPFLRTAQVQANLWTVIQARQTGDSVTALELLRQNRSMIDPSQLSYLRGRIFSDVGLDDIAVRFFEHASQLEPADDDYRWVVLDTLGRFDIARAQGAADAILASGMETSDKVLLKAAESRFASTRDMAIEARALARRALIPVFERAIIGLEAGRNRSESRSLLPLAYALCGFCFDDSGKFADAARCFDEALRLDPNNDALLTARGILFYGRDSRRAAADFNEAVALQPKIAWPYLFLAHYYLTYGRYEGCLAMCEHSLRFPSTDRVRANCYEWMAISQAMLGFEPQTVRSTFRSARQLAPQNERIRRNEETFECSLQQPSSDRIVWEKGDAREVTEMAKFEFRPVFGLAA